MKYFAICPDFNFILNHLIFQVIPSIVPFTFGDEEFNFDDAASAVCTVTKGDLQQLKIWWTFKSEDENFAYNLTTGDGVMITRNGQKLSVLNIEAVKARHRGNYTCYASNRGGFDQQSAYLFINGSILFFLVFKSFKILQFVLYKNSI